MGDPNILDVKTGYLLQLMLLLDNVKTRDVFLSAVPPEFFDANARQTLELQTRPGHWLLFHLGDQGARVSNFICWFLSANLENALLVLEVDVPLEIIRQPPSKMTIQEGSRLSISCEAVSFPRPEYQWFKEETELLLQEDPELVIPATNLADSGLYFCIISKRSARGLQNTQLRTDSVEVIVYSDIPPPVPCTKHKSKPFTLPLQQIPEVVNEQDVIEGNHAIGEEVSSEVQLNYSDPNLQTPSTSAILEKPYGMTKYFAEDKIALFIANDSYKAYEPLGTPATDVSDLAILLKKMSFKVFAFRNLNKIDMDKVLSVFYCNIKENSYALFFYAGHGFECDGQTYLQPVDCSASCMKDEAVCTEKIVQNLQKRKPALNVLLIDACRKPLPEWCGPRKIYKTHMENNTIYGYSTSFLCNSYECEERNSFFVKHLKKFISQDISIQEILMLVQEAFGDNDLNRYQSPVLKTSLSLRRKLNDSLRNSSILHPLTLSSYLNSWNTVRTKHLSWPDLKCIFIIENKNMEIFSNGVYVDVYVKIEKSAKLKVLQFIEINLEFNMPNVQVTPTKGALLKDLDLRYDFKNLLFRKEVFGIQHLRKEELDCKLVMIIPASKVSRAMPFSINIGHSWMDFESISTENVISEHISV